MKTTRLKKWVLLLSPVLAVVILTVYILTSNSSPSVLTTNDLIQQLEDKQHDVEVITSYTGYTEPSLFTIIPTKLVIDGHEILVYEFANSSVAETSKITVSDNGFQVGLMWLEWIDKPHFYASGNLIVQYIGSDRTLIGALRKILGHPFAGDKG